MCTADPGAERYKFSFTIRDTPSDYINVTCWGSEVYIRSLVDSFKISDVGEAQTKVYACHGNIWGGGAFEKYLLPLGYMDCMSLHTAVASLPPVIFCSVDFPPPPPPTIFLKEILHVHVYMRRLFHQDSLVCVFCPTHQWS